MNEIDDDVVPELSALLLRTADDFGVTLSSNKLSEEAIEEMHHKLKVHHADNIEIQMKQAEAEG